MILSVVVPVYNVEAYLKKCVRSLLDQDLSPEDYEILGEIASKISYKNAKEYFGF